MAFIYYFGFNFAIKKFNLMTPGREPLTADDEGDANLEPVDAGDDDKYMTQAKRVYAAIGGKDNISVIDNCTTRLRLQLVDTDNVNENAIKRSGAPGINKLDKHNLQIVIGTEVQFVADDLSRLFREGTPIDAAKPAETTAEPETAAASDIQSGVTSEFYSVAAGHYLDITEVPDSTFAQKLLGDGFAIDPSNGEIAAPVDGTIMTVFPTKHAIGFKTESGLEVLLHMGIDTVELKGAPFDVTVSEGDAVKHGDIVAHVDLDAIKAAGKQTPMIVIITNMDAVGLIKVNTPNAEVEPNTEVMSVTTK